MSWITDLEKAMRKPADEDEETTGAEMGAEDDGDEDEEEEYTPPTRKGISGTTTNPGSPKAGQKKVAKYAPKPNGETTGDDDDDEADVCDPKSIDRKTGGGPVKFASGGGTQKSLASQVSRETADAIEVSDILGDLAKGVQSLADAGAEQAAGVAAEVAKLNKGLAVIGKGLAFAIEQQARVLKGIQADVAEMGARPAPRQAKLKIVEKSFGDQGGDPGEGLPESRAIMQEKTFQAIQKGKITNEDAARMEAAYNRGETAIVKSLWRKVTA